MGLTKAVVCAPAVVAAGALSVALALPFGPARAQDKAKDKTYEMKISTPTIHDIPDTWANRSNSGSWTAFPKYFSTV